MGKRRVEGVYSTVCLCRCLDMYGPDMFDGGRHKFVRSQKLFVDNYRMMLHLGKGQIILNIGQFVGY